MSAVLKKEIELRIADRLGHIFERREKRLLEVVPTGIKEIDDVWGGLPRGAITELYGTASSGRTSLLISTLTAATSSEETCALIDCSDTFDLSSSAKAGVNFDRLLWVRCNDNLERAFKAVDLLLHGGGFGFIALNLADMPAKTLRRIISTWWFRFRRALENTPTVLVVTTPIACVRSCAAMALELKNDRALWPHTDSFVLGEDIPALTPLTAGVSPRLALVASRDRYTTGSSVINHAQLLQALTVQVNRQRPLEFNGHTIHFTPHFSTLP